jgi:hypothetical protein
MEPQPLKAAPPKPAATTEPKPAPLARGLNSLELEPPSATLSLSPKKAGELKAAPPASAPANESAKTENVQRPMTEALAQAIPTATQPPPAQTTTHPTQPAPMASNAPDFEKTLPLIYPEDDKK